jgi:hypothetical protein
MTAQRARTAAGRQPTVARRPHGVPLTSCGHPIFLIKIDLLFFFEALECSKGLGFLRGGGGV